MTWLIGMVYCCIVRLSIYVVSCCDVTFKVLQHIRKTFLEVGRDAKSTHRQVYKSNIIEMFLLLPNQSLNFLTRNPLLIQEYRCTYQE